jgi:hypothetical protein
MYEAYTFNDGSGVKTIHCCDHNGHPNPHIHDEPDAGLTIYETSEKNLRGYNISYAKSRPVAGGHGRARELTAYEKELLAAMREYY